MKPDENIREPFLWTEEKTDVARTKWITPTFTMDSTVLTLSTQKYDVNSLYNHYRNLIKLRKDNSPLSAGKTENIKSKRKEIISFSRTHKNTKLYVFHNVSEKTIVLPLEKKAFEKEILYKNGEVSLSADSLSVGSLGTVVLQEIK